MKVYPRLRIRLNKNLDKKVCYQFINFKKEGVDFGEGITKVHPDLMTAKSLSEKEKGKSISHYVDLFYEKNLKELERAMVLAEKEWELHKNDFFKITDKYFEKHLWPKGKYIAYLSIFNCNPRFLEDKTFQVYWRHPKGFMTVAVHEMLHFLFYDYISIKFNQKKFTDESLWRLSELIDYFLLEESEFIKITDDPYPDLYPNLSDLVYKLAPVWKRDRDIKKLTSYYLKIVRFFTHS